jgi:polysaccharide biosynthesis protein PslH
VRALVVTDSHPLPPSDGMRLHLAGVLPHLGAEHEVSLLSVPHPGDVVGEELERRLGLRRWTGVAPRPRSVLRRLADEPSALRHRRPVLVQQTLTSRLPRALEEAVRAARPDVVHLQPGWLAPLAARTDGVPAVVAPLDAARPNLEAELAVARGPRRALVRRELRRTTRLEATAYAACRAVVVVSEADAALLRAQDPRLSPVVVPNGVEPGPWRRPAGAARDPDLVVLTGAMSYPPNVDAAVFAATEVLPRLRRLRPSARLALVGRDPSREVRALAGDAVEVTGTVPEVAPWLWRAAAYLCPMRTGTGIKNKLLEALAAGCPVVATTAATGGLDAVPGRDLLVADEPDALARLLAGVLADPQRAERLGAGAAQAAERQSWARAAARLGEVWAGAAGR